MDIRIFPKYDDAEIIKVGNPALTSTIYQLPMRLGYKTTLEKRVFLCCSCIIKSARR
ncbi:MAG: hypothetical protein V9E96_00605 [Chitinophagaceae bacterium]